jgi:hypothetical protein
MCYHKAPPGTSAWQSFGMTKSEPGFTILNFYTDDDNGFYGTNAQYKDMALEFKELVQTIPFEPDIEKTEYSEHRLVKAHAANTTLGNTRTRLSNARCGT